MVIVLKPRIVSLLRFKARRIELMRDWTKYRSIPMHDCYNSRCRYKGVSQACSHVSINYREDTIQKNLLTSIQ